MTPNGTTQIQSSLGSPAPPRVWVWHWALGSASLAWPGLSVAMPVRSAGAMFQNASG